MTQPKSMSTPIKTPTPTNNLDSFVDLIVDVYLVLKDADSRTSVFETPIPGKFKEEDPMKLLDSFNEYLNQTPKLDTTIDEKFKTGQYTSFFRIYRDIKIASSLKIRDLAIGTEDYNNIDFFYRFASELLIRESSLAKISLSITTKHKYKPSELEIQISNDFEMISNSYSSANGEVITDSTEIPNPNVSAFQNSYQYGLNTSMNQQPSTIKIPLFTSLVGKSELDPRLTLVPNEYGLAKVVPLLKNSGSSGSTFESINHPSSKIPLPTNKPTTLLEGFHVLNWLPVGAPEWLSYKGKVLQPGIDSSLFKSQIPDEFGFSKLDNESIKSFGPTTDSQGFGVPSGLKASVWLSRVGLNKIDQLRAKYFEQLGIEYPQKGAKAKDQNGKSHDENIDETRNGNDDITDYDQTQPISVGELLNWDPTDINTLESIKANKSEILSSPKNLQGLISKEILKLNKLRQERFSNSDVNNVLAATNEEVMLYKRITKLITLSISLYKVNPSNLPIEFSKKIPVLVTEYSGTLPGIVTSKAKNNRLPTLRGSYKKKR